MYPFRVCMDSPFIGQGGTKQGTYLFGLDYS
jgi:hypothetical protein